MRKHLEAIAKKVPEKLSGPFGIGLMIGMTPLKGESSQVLNLTKRLFERGVITFIAGNDPTRLRLLVPAVIRDEEIDAIATLLEEEISR